MPQHLKNEPRIGTPDDFYAALTDLHRDLDLEESAKVNAKLVLLLANHIGDPAVLAEAIAAAKPKR
ncbi:DUF2783 domain-containing protein [Pelagibius litoralis]|uniref:DUF2783 domain-containing protein n=1 Tax=Pelagibius litoralis TaxID=374515 RepID=A0A967EX46_9PROT|nr:DUF2783 domain-containing protein [Pelagibius litoralis]NIA67655.1 DUF2783 domain-containing protein [Pelagibius litoralis]